MSVVQITFLTLFGRIIADGSKFIGDYVTSNFLAFVKSIEFLLVVTVAVAFLIIAVGILLRRAKRLPKSYMIEITDLDDVNDSPEGLRQAFATFDAAESYARFYRQMYGHQYRFKVVGSSKPFQKTCTVSTNDTENSRSSSTN